MGAFLRVDSIELDHQGRRACGGPKISAGPAPYFSFAENARREAKEREVKEREEASAAEEARRQETEAEASREALR